MRSACFRLAVLFACLCLIFTTSATLARADEAVARDIRDGTTIRGTGYDDLAFLFDGKTGKYHTSAAEASIVLENKDGMASLYLLFNLEYGSYRITDNDSGLSITAGEYGFLHEYVDLKDKFGYCPTSVTLSFASGSVRLSEIYVFSEGTPPEYVQLWQPSLDGGADILLLATHGDDDQLFFAGLLPLYAGEMDCRVQVMYLTDHRNLTNARTHEMLNGLWAVGVEAYPVFGDFDDFRIDSLSGTYAEYARLGTSKNDLLDFVVSNIRRFRPQVIVGHDINGEYGHGMHMVYTDLLIEALELTNDPAVFPASAERYGVWDVPKTYLHLYEENRIVLDYDQPLTYFDGLTAFQATQKLGYPCHVSQQYTWFTRWLNGNSGDITKATQISTYNPCHFGLYRSTVGRDEKKNDFLENITTYARQEALDQAAAESVISRIDALGPVTLDSGEAIRALRDAYEALSERQQALVSNLNILTDAEAAYDSLVQAKEEKDAVDQAAAEAVIALIDRITFSLEDASPLTQAQAAYDALAEDQKKLVTNLGALIQAQENYAALVQQEQLRQEQLQKEQQALLEAQQHQLRQLCYLLLILLVLFFFALMLLGHKKRAYRKK